MAGHGFTAGGWLCSSFMSFVFLTFTLTASYYYRHILILVAFLLYYYLLALFTAQLQTSTRARDTTIVLVDNITTSPLENREEEEGIRGTVMIRAR